MVRDLARANQLELPVHLQQQLRQGQPQSQLHLPPTSGNSNSTSAPHTPAETTAAASHAECTGSGPNPALRCVTALDLVTANSGASGAGAGYVAAAAGSSGRPVSPFLTASPAGPCPGGAGGQSLAAAVAAGAATSSGAGPTPSSSVLATSYPASSRYLTAAAVATPASNSLGLLAMGSGGSAAGGPGGAGGTLAPSARAGGSAAEVFLAQPPRAAAAGPLLLPAAPTSGARAEGSTAAAFVTAAAAASDASMMLPVPPPQPLLQPAPGGGPQQTQAPLPLPRTLFDTTAAAPALHAVSRGLPSSASALTNTTHSSTSNSVSHNYGAHGPIVRAGAGGALAGTMAALAVGGQRRPPPPLQATAAAGSAAAFGSAVSALLPWQVAVRQQDPMHHLRGMALARAALAVVEDMESATMSSTVNSNLLRDMPPHSHVTAGSGSSADAGAQFGTTAAAGTSATANHPAVHDNSTQAIAAAAARGDTPRLVSYADAELIEPSFAYMEAAGMHAVRYTAAPATAATAAADGTVTGGSATAASASAGGGMPEPAVAAAMLAALPAEVPVPLLRLPQHSIVDLVAVRSGSGNISVNAGAATHVLTTTQEANAPASADTASGNAAAASAAAPAALEACDTSSLDSGGSGRAATGGVLGSSSTVRPTTYTAAHSTSTNTNTTYAGTAGAAAITSSSNNQLTTATHLSSSWANTTDRDARSSTFWHSTTTGLAMTTTAWAAASGGGVHSSLGTGSRQQLRQVGHTSIGPGGAGGGVGGASNSVGQQSGSIGRLGMMMERSVLYELFSRRSSRATGAPTNDDDFVVMTDAGILVGSVGQSVSGSRQHLLQLQLQGVGEGLPGGVPAATALSLADGAAGASAGGGGGGAGGGGLLAAVPEAHVGFMVAAGNGGGGRGSSARAGRYYHIEPAFLPMYGDGVLGQSLAYGAAAAPAATDPAALLPPRVLRSAALAGGRDKAGGAGRHGDRMAAAGSSATAGGAVMAAGAVHPHSLLPPVREEAAAPTSTSSVHTSYTGTGVSGSLAAHSGPGVGVGTGGGSNAGGAGTGGDSGVVDSSGLLLLYGSGAAGGGSSRGGSSTGVPAVAQPAGSSIGHPHSRGSSTHQYFQGLPPGSAGGATGTSGGAYLPRPNYFNTVYGSTGNDEGSGSDGSLPLFSMLQAGLARAREREAASRASGAAVPRSTGTSAPAAPAAAASPPSMSAALGRDAAAGASVAAPTASSVTNRDG